MHYRRKKRSISLCINETNSTKDVGANFIPINSVKVEGHFFVSRMTRSARPVTLPALSGKHTCYTGPCSMCMPSSDICVHNRKVAVTIGSDRIVQATNKN